MTTSSKTSDLGTAIETWKGHAKSAVELRAVLTRAHAAGLAKSDGKNAESRRADADLATVTERMALELAEIEARAARWVVESIVGERAMDTTREARERQEAA